MEICKVSKDVEILSHHKGWCQVMSICKLVCMNFVAKKESSRAVRYGDGVVYCKHCRKFMRYEGKYCPCCSHLVRHSCRYSVKV